MSRDIEGSLYIDRLAEQTPTKPLVFGVVFVPDPPRASWRSGVNTYKKIYGEDKLDTFLKELGAGEPMISDTLIRLRKEGSATVHMNLAEEKLIAHELNPPDSSF